MAALLTGCQLVVNVPLKALRASNTSISSRSLRMLRPHLELTLEPGTLLSGCWDRWSSQKSKYHLVGQLTRPHLELTLEPGTPLAITDLDEDDEDVWVATTNLASSRAHTRACWHTTCWHLLMKRMMSTCEWPHLGGEMPQAPVSHQRFHLSQSLLTWNKAYYDDCISMLLGALIAMVS